MNKTLFYFSVLLLLYNCSPINKQHGYLAIDLIDSAQSIENFKINQTSKEEIRKKMGSPSIVIGDIGDTWIYLLSSYENKIFEDDKLNFQIIFRFHFNENNILVEKNTYNNENYTKIAFSNDKTKIARDAYGISDQIYEAFTRGNN